MPRESVCLGSRSSRGRRSLPSRASRQSTRAFTSEIEQAGARKGSTCIGLRSGRTSQLKSGWGINTKPLYLTAGSWGLLIGSPACTTEIPFSMPFEPNFQLLARFFVKAR
jgi:hypothetical protein